MMRRARDTIFWLGMSKEIKQIAYNCITCQNLKPNNQKKFLKQYNEGLYPWEKYDVDLFQVNCKVYPIVVDYFSNFFEIDILTKITTKQIIHCVKKHFARYGIPKVIVSDCGSQFISQILVCFVKRHVIHITSSPGHQQENGKAEAAVKAAKHLLKTTSRNHEDQYLAHLGLRNTIRQDVNVSPSQIIFGRQTRSVIPKLIKYSSPHAMNLEKRRKRQDKQYDKTAKNLPPVSVGDKIYFQSPDGKEWSKSEIIKKIG